MLRAQAASAFHDQEYSSIPGEKVSIQMVSLKNRDMEYCKVQTM
jgi:hypothetical protein